MSTLQVVIPLFPQFTALDGIGKIKRDLFRQMAGDAALARMRALKKILDPDTLLNPGNILEPSETPAPP